MPLDCQIFRNGKALAMKWTDWIPAGMVAAAAFESEADDFKDFGPNDPENYPSSPQGINYRNVIDLCNYHVIGALFRAGEVTLEREHRFVGPQGDELKLEPGDVLRMHRTYKGAAS